MTVSLRAPQLRVISGGSDAEPTDSDLVGAFSAGDVGAFGVLVERHQDTLLRVVRRYAPSVDDARDLMQRSFLQAFEAAERSLPRLGTVPFKAWLLRIAINLGKNHLRDSGRWLKAPLEAVDRERAGGTVHEAFERAEAEALTRRAVLELPPRQRDVFSLRIDAGLPFAEVGRVLEISEDNAKAHFSHAVKRLKAIVAALSSNPGGAS